MRRPFQGKEIAFHAGRTAASLKSPDKDPFSGFLSYLAEINERFGSRDRSLFFKLPLSSRKVVLTRIDQSLWDRPRSILFSGPERTTRMHQENLQNGPRVSIHQKPGAHLRHAANLITRKTEPQLKVKAE